MRRRISINKQKSVNDFEKHLVIILLFLILLTNIQSRTMGEGCFKISSSKKSQMESKIYVKLFLHYLQELLRDRIVSSFFLFNLMEKFFS